MASNRVPVIAVSLAALTVFGAATANSLPNRHGISLPDFNQFLPEVDRIALPDFSSFLPQDKVVEVPPPPPPVLVPDPVVRAGLRDIQSSEDRNAAALESLTQSAATQQADLKRITRQLAVLSAQVSSLQNPATPPMTTSGIAPTSNVLPPSSVAPTSSVFPVPASGFSLPLTSGTPPMTTPSVPPPSPRLRTVRAPRKPIPPPPFVPDLPPPAGPISVGGAPLAPLPATGSDES